MSALSSEPCCRTSELAGGSVVDKMIDIQNDYKEKNTKSIEWVENLKVLSVVPEREKTLRETRIADKNFDRPRNYVAVSYSCEPMEGEIIGSPDYKITTERQSQRKNKVRNIVIFRVLRFAKHVDSPLFWIDQECVNQSKNREKQKAMDSMDLVYSKSKHPVGLLSIVLSDPEDILSLRKLLYGKTVPSKWQEDSWTLVDCDDETSARIMRLLKFLRGDCWWDRAWIFQEEYLAGQRMTLLVRHSCKLEDVKREAFKEDYHDSEFINGEICIPATHFRERATIFLRDLVQDPGIFPKTRERCKNLLDCFTKYNILYRDKAAAGGGKAMWAMIFADLGARKVGRPYDVLPIAANSCDYAVRLDSQKLADEEPLAHSVGLCALTMALLNGELITDAALIEKHPTDMTAAEYLDCISFCEFDPPVGRGELTWLKSCRLSNVKLCHDGIHTKGHLWRVYSLFDITDWQLLQPPSDDIQRAKYERTCLFELARKLQRAAKNPRNSISITQLPELLRGYLNTLWKTYESQDSTPTMDYMSLMASEIVRAIHENQTQFLSLAVLEGSDDQRYAIFVGDHSDSLLFTSWFDRTDEDGRHRTKHVSLKVEIDDSKGFSRMRNTGWVNGITFWQGHKQTEAVFQWPTVWERKNCPWRKRKRDADDD